MDSEIGKPKARSIKYSFRMNLKQELRDIAAECAVGDEKKSS